MYSDKPVYRSFPKVPIDRRAGAFLIDFVAVWLLTSFFPNPFVQFLVFNIVWLVVRVVLVDKNQGQSLGRWAMDMKVIDAKDNRLPTLLSLGKREGIIALAAALAMTGLNLNFRSPLSMILLIAPLAVDCGMALADEQYNQAFHDRFAKTYIIQTQRGFSLDLRMKKLVVQLKRSLRR